MSQGDRAQETSADAGQQELHELRARMGVIRDEVTADVERKWTSPWRNPEVFALKVTTRLAGHQEYRSLRVRVAQVEAALATRSSTEPT